MSNNDYLLTDDELFSDTYKMTLVDNVMWEVVGKVITKSGQASYRITKWHFASILNEAPCLIVNARSRVNSNFGVRSI